MSAGTPVTTLRIPQDLLNEVKFYLDKRAANPVVEPWTLTDFILAAIKDKLEHGRRSRSNRKLKDGSSDIIDMADLVDGSPLFNDPPYSGEKIP